ncbi:MAG: hypothetical protein WC373_01725 [Smithella sp.]|jgi:hypothetical protein
MKVEDIKKVSGLIRDLDYVEEGYSEWENDGKRYLFPTCDPETYEKIRVMVLVDLENKKKQIIEQIEAL